MSVGSRPASRPPQRNRRAVQLAITSGRGIENCGPGRTSCSTELPETASRSCVFCTSAWISDAIFHRDGGTVTGTPEASPVLFDVLPQCGIDAGLIPVALGPEPMQEVRIEPKGDLFFDRPIEDAPPGPRPIRDLGDVAGVDLVIGQCGESIEFGILFVGQFLSHLRMPSFPAGSPGAR